MNNCGGPVRLVVLPGGVFCFQSYLSGCSPFSQFYIWGVETMLNDDWDIPVGVVGKGREAAEVIRAFVLEHELGFTGGCRVFADPAQWDEGYGLKSLLVVVHEGTAADVCLNMDGAWERSSSYDLFEELMERLRGVGVYMEQCTRCYSAVYEI